MTKVDIKTVSRATKYGGQLGRQLALIEEETYVPKLASGIEKQIGVNPVCSAAMDTELSPARSLLLLARARP